VRIIGTSSALPLSDIGLRIKTYTSGSSYAQGGEIGREGESEQRVADWTSAKSGKYNQDGKHQLGPIHAFARIVLR
jgi:hypothetical protein